MIIKYIYTKFFCIKLINSWFVYVSVHMHMCACLLLLWTSSNINSKQFFKMSPDMYLLLGSPKCSQLRST